MSRRECSLALSRLAAPLFDISDDDVWDALTYVPDHLLHLLDRPDGWAALVAMVTADLGVRAPNFRPSIN